MPIKAMTDHQRVKAGNWIESKKEWIERKPFLTKIAEEAGKKLGFRVTVWFVRNYLNDTEWWNEIKTAKADPVKGEEVERAVSLLIEVVEQIMSDRPVSTGEIEGTIRKAKSLIAKSERSRRRSDFGFDLITEAQMKGGHA